MIMYTFVSRPVINTTFVDIDDLQEINNEPQLFYNVQQPIYLHQLTAG
jgi:hypothetical protein